MSLPDRKTAPVKPRDTASLVLVDRRDEEPRVLMGKRHAPVAFVPDASGIPLFGYRSGRPIIHPRHRVQA